jgi:hypothetical protein
MAILRKYAPVTTELDNEAVSPALPSKGRGWAMVVLDIPSYLIQTMIGRPFDISAFP